MRVRLRLALQEGVHRRSEDEGVGAGLAEHLAARPARASGQASLSAQRGQARPNGRGGVSAREPWPALCRRTHRPAAPATLPLYRARSAERFVGWFSLPVSPSRHKTHINPGGNEIEGVVFVLNVQELQEPQGLSALWQPVSSVIRLQRFDSLLCACGHVVDLVSPPRKEVILFEKNRELGPFVGFCSGKTPSQVIES